MVTEEQIEKLVERLVDRMEKANAFFLKNIGQYIKEIKKLSPSKAYQLIQTLKYGGSFLEIEKELAKYTNMNIQDIDEIFKEYARIDQSFYENFYKYRNIPFVPLEENKTILQQTQAIANITKQTMIGLTQTRTIGYSITDLENNVHFYTLRDTFQRIMDEALLNISQGKETMAQSMRRIINDIGSSGLKTFNYESGRTMRVDSAIRMQLKDGLRQLHNENREVYAQEFKSDGVEVSVHLNPAPDHEEVQGHQFSNEEFKKFQEDMDSKDVNGKIFTADYNGRDRRAISQYNCYHYIFPIIIGVNKPQYSEEQLQKIIDNNNKGFDLDGKHYTNYEGTQLQRALETKIREQKDIQILAKASDDKDLVLKSQDNITKLTRKYKELSEKSGLSTKMERLTVSGYQRTNINKVINKNEFKRYNIEHPMVDYKKYAKDFNFKGNEYLDEYVKQSSQMSNMMKDNPEYKKEMYKLAENIDGLKQPVKENIVLYSGQNKDYDLTKSKFVISTTIGYQTAFGYVKQFSSNAKNMDIFEIFVEKGANLISTVNTNIQQFNKQGELIIPISEIKNLVKIDKKTYLLKRRK